METTIGGDRLGSGNKQTTSFRNYERSSHDLGFVWRSSMSSGTLVPFLCKVALPGDKWEIDLNAEVLTLPTIGPLFGSYKVQLDVFEIPMRLYNAKLHMNKLGVGMDMSNIFLPQIELRCKNERAYSRQPGYLDNEQINASSLIKYLGVSGLGSYTGNTNPVIRYFNAVPLLAYWDIYKNYYSNKQEEIGYMIHTSWANYGSAQTPIAGRLFRKNGVFKSDVLEPASATLNTDDFLQVKFVGWAKEPLPSSIQVAVDGVVGNAEGHFTTFSWNPATATMLCTGAKSISNGLSITLNKYATTPVNSPRYFFGLQSFPLENIDTMREQILQFAGAGAFTISQSSLSPFNAMMETIDTGAEIFFPVQFSQESLALKTYQSDLFNNWINTEWIDGAGGISELTAVDTSTGDFTIDALNIATKVYDMLNRIAVSGGTYDDWLEAVYTHERVKGVENPVYCGSLIKELAFEEVVSLAETIDSTDGRKAPLGTLAGRGRLTGKHKGGRIEISVSEPSYIMGLVSLTPRIDFSQGNDWDVNLKTYDDLHKPALDGIGFQDLITEQLLWSDTTIDTTNAMDVAQKSLGKQPAWINYMTSVNKTFGAFAETDNSMFMTLNRRYERKDDGSGLLKDGTTYIDPTKYNQIFAEVALDSQNFWVQIACDITARRKMSAKIIPNL